MVTRSGGFTLVELLVVLLLLGLALAAVVVRVNVHDSGAAARREALRLASGLDLARVVATSHGITVHWHPTEAGGYFTLLDTGDMRHASSAPATVAQPDPGDLGLATATLPAGYRLTVQRPAGTRGPLAFHPDGSHAVAGLTVQGAAGVVARIRLAGHGPVRLAAQEMTADWHDDAP